MNPCYEISPTRNLSIGKFSTLPAAPYPSIICVQLLTVNSYDTSISRTFPGLITSNTQINVMRLDRKSDLAASLGPFSMSSDISDGVTSTTVLSRSACSSMMTNSAWQIPCAQPNCHANLTRSSNGQPRNGYCMSSFTGARVGSVSSDLSSVSTRTAE
jgi:hypothetical protein